MEDYSFVGKDPGLKLPSYYLGFALAMYTALLRTICGMCRL